MATKDQWLPGEKAYFEYHCWESYESQDAPVWLHSHQLVTILLENESDRQREYLPTLAERGEEGMPITYQIKFSDGLIWTAFEDELMTSPVDYEMANPPGS